MALTFPNEELTTNVSTDLRPGGYQDIGVGNSMAYREVTRKAAFRHSSPTSSQGETAGAGSSYTLALNERPNLSNPRNRGPERAPSPLGGTAMPVITTEQRKTGRIA